MYSPRLVQWRGQWYVFYHDPATGKQKRRSCLRAGARTDDERRRFLASIRDEVTLAGGEVLRLGAVAFDTPIADALRRYLAHVGRQVQAGEMSPASLASIRKTLDPMIEWAGHTRTGDLDGPRIQAFIQQRAKGLSPATANLHRRNVKAALRWLDTMRPRLYPDSAIFWPALRQKRQDHPRGVAMTSIEIQAAHAVLPEGQAYLFRFYACTGCRRSDAITAELQGNVLVMQSKRGRTRFVPLAEVAPGLLAMLKESGMPPPLDEWLWRTTLGFLPQRLRRNFTSYAAALGIPPAVSAMWQGHSLAVAEAYYRQQLLERVHAPTIEAAMGFEADPR